MDIGSRQMSLPFTAPNNSTRFRHLRQLNCYPARPQVADSGMAFSKKGSCEISRGVSPDE